MLLTRAGDGYRSVPQKMLTAFRYCVDTFDFDFIFKCDDDTYAVLPRISSYPLQGKDYVGRKLSQGQASGSAIFMSRRAVLAVLDHFKKRRKFYNIYDDVNYAYALYHAGIKLRDERKFIAFHDGRSYPTPKNKIITYHHCPPDRMRKIHTAFMPKALLTA